MPAKSNNTGGRGGRRPGAGRKKNAVKEKQAARIPGLHGQRGTARLRKSRDHGGDERLLRDDGSRRIFRRDLRLHGFHERMNDSRLTAHTQWVAQYASKCTYSGSYGIWQHSSSGRVSGDPEAHRRAAELHKKTANRYHRI